MTIQQLEKLNTNNLIKFFQSLEKIDLNISTSMYLETKDYISLQENDLDFRYIDYKEDIKSYLEIIHNTFSKTINENLSIEFIKNISKHDNVELLLVFKNKKAIGTALIIENNNKVNLYLLSVLSEYAKLDIYSKIIQEIVDFTKREKISYIEVQVSNLKLDTFKKLGFKELKT